MADLGKLDELFAGDAWKLTPATFRHRLSEGGWVPARHLLFASTTIASHLARGNARLIISWPPRHGKSELISISTPAWALDTWPSWKIALTSYGADLSEEWSAQVRDMLLEHEDSGNLNVRLRKDRIRVDKFFTTAGGACYAVGLGGVLTGRGANLLIVDDFHKNPKEAASKSFRDDIFDWFVSVANTRMEPNGNIIIVAARWDVDDLIGRLERDAPDVWTHIKLSAIARENDPLGRSPGEALWPERYDEKALAMIQRTLGDYFWSALYQQAPKRKSQLMQKATIDAVDILPHRSFLRFVRAWDFAASEDANDFTVGALLAEDTRTNVIYICDLIRDQWGPADLELKVAETAQNDGLEVKIDLEQEPGSAGKNLVSYYIRHVLRGYNVVATPATQSKFIRAQPFLAQIGAGNVRMARANWNRPLLDELESFPEGDHDDQVDACSAAFNRLAGKFIGGATWGRDNDPVAQMLQRIKAQDQPQTKRLGATWR